MKAIWKRLLSAALVLTLVLGMVPAQAAPADGQFYWAAATEDGIVVEPEALSYTAGQTVKEALLSSHHRFTGLEQGFIQAVDGVAAGYFLGYDNGGYDLNIPAAEITTLILSTTDTPWTPASGALLLELGAFRENDSGVQAYPAAKTAYQEALRCFSTGSGAEEALEQLKAAMSEFETLQNGPKTQAKFQITQAGAAVSQAEITLTGPYGDVHTAQGTAIEVIPGDYQFEISDGTGNLCRGDLTLGDAAQTWNITLPSGQWVKSVDLLDENGEAYPKTLDTAQASAYDIPDTVNTLYVCGHQGLDVPDPQNTKFWTAYAQLDGDIFHNVRPWGSTASALPDAIEKDMVGRDILMEAQYVEPDTGFAQVQQYTLTLNRVPTVKNMQVEADGVVLPLFFDSNTHAYTVSTIHDRLTVSVETWNREGYTVLVNGEVLNGDTTTVPAQDFTVEVLHENGSSQTYSVAVSKKSPARVTVTPASGTKIQIFNAAEAEIFPISGNLYDLVPGESYRYVAVLQDHYFATETFTASQGLSISGAKPKAETWIDGIRAGGGTKASELDRKEYLPTPAFDPAIHAYTYTVSDCSNMFALWLTGAEGLTVTADYTRLSNGRAEHKNLTVGKAQGQNLGGFMEKSAAGNTALLRVQKTQGSVTYYQEFTLTAERSLRAYDLRLEAEGTVLPIDPAYDRDVMEYTAELPQGAQELTVTLKFPQTQKGEATYGGYTANLWVGDHMETLSYVHDTELSVVLPLDPMLETETVYVEILHENAISSTYAVTLRKLAPVTAAFTVSPAEAVVFVTDTLTGNRALPNAEGKLVLMQGHAYTYTVSLPGYLSKTGTLTADRNQEISVSLDAAPENPAIPEAMDAVWPDFRGSKENNAVVSAPLPIGDEESVLYWAVRLGEGYDSGAVGSPILVDDYLYTYAGKHIYKVNRLTGEVEAEGPMVRSSSFAINAPTYADGMVFVGLANGGVQAFNADTLESLWVYNDPLGGQPNCSITYEDGFLYTGFWNGEEKDANFVCLTATDEDPTRPDEEKNAVWTHPIQGGYYWAGACIQDGNLLLGTDDGKSGWETGHATVFSFEARTGLIQDSFQLSEPGDIRCSIVYDAAEDRFCFTSKGGYFYTVQLNADGSFREDSLKTIALSNQVKGSVPMSTSTPVVYNGRAYIGVSGKEQFGPYSGHNITVLDLQKNTVAYTVPTQGYPQTSGLLTTAYEEATGEVYVYFFDNFTPGKLRLLADAPGYTQPRMVTTETYVEKGREKKIDAAYNLFTPSGEQAQYAICSPICDADGTIYFKNDSGFLMALGSTVEELRVTHLPEKLRYEPGEVFDPTGLSVEARFTNGITRDVTDAIRYGTEPLTEEDTELFLFYPFVMYQNKNGQAGTEYPEPVTILDLRIGAADPDELAAEQVEQLISAIPFPVTEESREAIAAARAAYDLLTPAQQLLVRNYDRLLEAEKALEAGPTEPTDPEPTEPEPTEPDPTEPDPTEPGKPVEFSDVKEKHWFYEAVLWAVQNGVTNGYTDGTFRPNQECIRREVVTFLWNAEGKPEISEDAVNPFKDVKDGQWYTTPILWAAQNGITAGKGAADTFAPKDDIMRREFVTFLWRAAGKPEPNITLEDTPFTDVDEGKWYTDPILWAYENGITNGKGQADTFAPKDTCTRAEIVTFLSRAYKN